MKLWFGLLSLLLFLLSGCLVEQAPVAKDRQLVVFADKLTAQDSLFLNQYAKKHHVDLSYHQLNADYIKNKIIHNKFDIDVDILILSNQQIREELNALKLLKTITNESLFTDLNRQFNNTHHFWLPLSHNPLVVAMQKDSSNMCRTIYFEEWHKKDSLKPQFLLSPWEKMYLTELEKSKRYDRFTKQLNKSKLADERVYPLSKLVQLENNKDTNYRKGKNSCKTFLIDHKKYITVFSSVSIYRYGRNYTESNRFISAITKYAAIFASSRDQLPCFNQVTKSSKIKGLGVK